MADQTPGGAKIEVNDALQSFVDWGRTVSSVRWIGGRPFAIAPMETVLYDLEPLAEKPSRKMAKISVDRVQSLVQYVKAYGGKDGSTMAFASLDNAAVRVVLDYHSAAKGEARWCGHQVTFRLRETREWKEWLASDGRKMTQVDFAEFLEDRMVDIVEPPAADVFSLVRTLEAKRKVNFSSAVRLEDGTAKINWEDEIETRGGKEKGQIEVPSMLTLGIRPFEGMDKWKLEVRLRYRLSEGNVWFWYQIVEPDRVKEAAFEDQVQTFEKDAGLTCIRGAVTAIPDPEEGVRKTYPRDI